MGDGEGDGNRDGGGNQCGQERPFDAFGFFINGEQSGPARIMKQGKKHHIECRQPCPSVVEQDLFQIGQLINFHHGAGC